MGYLYDGYGALTSGNGGDKNFVEELNPEWDVYLRTDGTKLEACAVFTSGTVCSPYGRWDCDYNMTTHTCNNTTGYVMSKKQEAENKGATCHFEEMPRGSGPDPEYYQILVCNVANKSQLELDSYGSATSKSALWEEMRDSGNYNTGLYWGVNGTCLTNQHISCTND